MIKSAKRPAENVRPEMVSGAVLPVDPCPYVCVAVSPVLPRPKWGGPPKPDAFKKENTKPTRGYMMVDTGATITIVTKRWCETHAIPIRSGG